MERSSVGKHIRELRRAKGLTGNELAERTGFSAAAISKFERGLLRPNNTFIEKTVSALNLTPKEALALREVGALFNAQFQRWSMDPGQVEELQALVGQRERNSNTIRAFMNQVVPGLLQSEHYMRSLFTSFSSQRDNELKRLIMARKERQKILKQKNRSFVFVLGEGCLRSSFQSPEALSDQLSHLNDLIENSPSVEIRILPFARTLTRLVMHHFILYDERTVNIEVLKGDLDLWETEDVNYYIELMNYLVSVSLTPSKSHEMITSIMRTLSTGE